MTTTPLTLRTQVFVLQKYIRRMGSFTCLSAPITTPSEHRNPTDIVIHVSPSAFEGILCVYFCAVNNPAENYFAHRLGAVVFPVQPRAALLHLSLEREKMRIAATASVPQTRGCVKPFLAREQNLIIAEVP